MFSKQSVLFLFTCSICFSISVLSYFDTNAAEPIQSVRDDSASQENDDNGHPVVEMKTIVVTAEKRESNVREIPGSVSVVSERQVDDYDVKSTMDIVNMTPNLYITETGNALMTTFAAMRGITGSMSQIPAVGFYVDDVYYSSLDIGLFDVERIEVLRGPQGTLYGRNAEAGIINIITKQPSDIWETSLRLDAGEYDTFEARGSLSGPIIDDKLAFRAAFRYYNTDGYFEDMVSGADDVGSAENIDARFSLKSTPSDDLDLTLAYDLQRYDSPKYAHFAPLDGGDLRESITVDYPGETSKDADGASLRAEYRMGDVRLVSVTSGRSEDHFITNDIDFTPFDLMRLMVARDLTSWTQEFRVLSDTEDEPLQWLGGLFLLSEDDDRHYETWMNFMNMGMGMPGETLTQKSGTETFGIALFGEASYMFNDRLKATLGMRYDREEKEFDYEQIPGGPVFATMFGYPSDAGSADDVFDAWLPKAALSYTLSDEVMSYVSVSRGFRSGGFNDKEQMGSAFKPEFTWNYELGTKTSWLDGRLQVNVALFYIDWSDMQVEIMTEGGTSFWLDNAAKATSKGAELELFALPVTGLELIAGAAYTDASYDDYRRGPEMFDGKKVIDSPEFTLNLGGTYRFGGGFMVNAIYNHFGEIYFDPANTRSQENYGLLSAKIGYETEDLDVYFYGRNLFDKEYATRAFEVNDTWYGRAGEPRTFGVTVSARL
ncbi:TonB-dependent receptor [Prosthecochloris sp. SCSIO W1101]|uniref:TonB-dependent receptor n=1 Tax=Prosthecochloris sp. SCSIO W1101 TaxID=2992242 RepID=UPI00223E4F75|nr:TonB-dependent receptor [Prosthecochloris sp. SCSIO W1101]UZJ40542.1 TonB-dependent receptor [Prosthecochloris sp. SCSIO W1101]